MFKGAYTGPESELRKILGMKPRIGLIEYRERRDFRRDQYIFDASVVDDQGESATISLFVRPEHYFLGGISREEWIWDRLEKGPSDNYASISHLGQLAAAQPIELFRAD